MSTTKDLSDLIDHEMGKGQGPFLIRICQDAGLLPKVKRGGWRSMTELTAEHLADFVIAVAGTRPSGARNVMGVRTALERFAVMTCEWDDILGVYTDRAERGDRSLRDDIADFLGQYRDIRRIGDGYHILRILFISDERDPEVEIHLIRTYGDGPEQFLHYTNPGPEPSSVREAVVIGGNLFLQLAELLRAPAPEEATA